MRRAFFFTFVFLAFSSFAHQERDFCVKPFLEVASLSPGTLKLLSVDTKAGKIAVLKSAQIDEKLPCVVFIHNNSGCKEVFIRLFEALRGKVNIIAVDLPGHGSSDNAVDPPSTYSFQGYAHVVVETLDSLQIDKFVPVGWSLGGHVAIEMMHLYPQRLLGVITTGAPAITTGFWAPLLAFNVFRMWWKGVLSMIGQGRAFTKAEAEFFLESGGIAEPSNFFVEAAMRTDGKARSLMAASIASGVGVSDERALLETNPIPIGIVIGVNDPGVSASYIRGSSRYYRNARVIELETDHATPWNEPVAFAEFLVDFIWNNCMAKPLASC